MKAKRPRHLNIGMVNIYLSPFTKLSSLQDTVKGRERERESELFDAIDLALDGYDEVDTFAGLRRQNYKLFLCRNEGF